MDACVWQVAMATRLHSKYFKVKPGRTEPAKNVLLGEMFRFLGVRQINTQFYLKFYSGLQKHIFSIQMFLIFSSPVTIDLLT